MVDFRCRIRVVFESRIRIQSRFLLEGRIRIKSRGSATLPQGKKAKKSNLLYLAQILNIDIICMD